MMKEEWYLHFS